MIPSARDPVERVLQDFLSRMCTTCAAAPCAARSSARPRPPRQFEHVALGDQRLEPRAEALLQPLRSTVPQPVNTDVCGHVAARAEQRSLYAGSSTTARSGIPDRCSAPAAT